MHWKFEERFSIRVWHQQMLDKTPVDPANYAYEFAVVPTTATRARFQQLGWIIKIEADRTWVLEERTIKADGSSFARGIPAPSEAFQFYLQLRQPSVMAYTRPFAKLDNGAIVPDKNLPRYSGQGPFIYLDNRDTVAETADDGEAIHRLTAGTHVDVADFGSRGNTPFLFRTEAATRNKVIAKQVLADGHGDPVEYPVASPARSVVMDLPASAWQITQQPLGNTELLYLSDTPLPPKTVGIIQIFNTDEWPQGQFRSFQALFTRPQ